MLKQKPAQRTAPVPVLYNSNYQPIKEQVPENDGKTKKIRRQFLQPYINKFSMDPSDRTTSGGPVRCELCPVWLLSRADLCHLRTQAFLKNETWAQKPQILQTNIFACRALQKCCCNAIVSACAIYSWARRGTIWFTFPALEHRSDEINSHWLKFQLLRFICFIARKLRYWEAV